MKTIAKLALVMAAIALPLTLSASEACKKCCKGKCAECCKDKGKKCGTDCCKGE